MLGGLSDDAPPDAGEPTEAYPEPSETVDRPGVAIGRYRLLELVGAGGMGMVWGAWDPELERRVALKLVRLTSQASRERMLREGQVLARLSHPNIVPIFDIGALGDQVYLVMEWVRGTTLHAYAAAAPGTRAVLDAYRQAGRGLEAAHDAGVIHRDFKPGNAIRGDDGRVRVLDFGLARAGEDRPVGAEALAGTPRYMPPEQARGEAVTAAGDQYAFCVSLREALERTGETPGWIAAILERGTAADPAGRFASMGELLAALDRDPARRRRRAALGVGALVAAAGAFAIGRSGAPPASPAIEPCTGAAAELAASWSPEVRERAVAHLRTLGPPVTAAQIDDLARRLDDYAGAWVAEHRDACLAGERGALTPQLHEARFGCLLRARSQLGGVGELLGKAATAEDLARVQRSAGALPDVHGCSAAEPVPPPPAAMAAQVAAIAPRIEQVLVRVVAGYTDALAAATAATAEARGTGYDPLVSRALLVQGRAAIAARDGSARDALGEAWRVALRAFDEPLAVEAYARWAYALVRFGAAPPAAGAGAAPAAGQGDGATSLEMWPMMSVLAERLADRGRFARALLYNNVALHRMVGDDRTGAHELFGRAWGAAGDRPEVELIAILENLARLETDPAASERQLRQALARREAALGATHPDVMVARRNLAFVIRARGEARAALEQACADLRAWKQEVDFQLCAYEAGWLADEDGDEAAAGAWMALASGLRIAQGRIAAAYAAKPPERARLLAELERLAGGALPNLVARMDAADALLVLARAAEGAAGGGAGSVAEVDRAWERAVSMLATIQYGYFHRRKARAQRVLAERWATSRPAVAGALATLALAWYRGARGDEGVVERLERVAAAATSRSQGGSR
jgi:hypothetical protein